MDVLMSLNALCFIDSKHYPRSMVHATGICGEDRVRRAKIGQLDNA
jgi:hypothetical protein